MGRVKPARVQPSRAVSVLVAWKAGSHWVGINASCHGGECWCSCSSSITTKQDLHLKHSGEATAKCVCTNSNMSLLICTKEQLEISCLYYCHGLKNNAWRNIAIYFDVDPKSNAFQCDFVREQEEWGSSWRWKESGAEDDPSTGSVSPMGTIPWDLSWGLVVLSISQFYIILVLQAWLAFWFVCFWKSCKPCTALTYQEKYLLPWTLDSLV